MEIETFHLRRCDLIRVSGRIDSSNAAEFSEKLMATLRDGHGNLVINLGGVEYLSSAALRALIAVLKEARGRVVGKGNVLLAEVPEQIREVFDLAALSSLFEFYADETLAVGSF